jgi:5-methylcytosine-specific restriction enzyme subunit McrC
MPNHDKILTLQEYGPPILIRDAAKILGLEKEAFWFLLNKALTSIDVNFSRGSCIETIGLNSFRFVGIAGILALKANLRIEIIPKFLNPKSSEWREDFIAIALLTRYGHLLHNIPISSKPMKGLDLYEIVAESWINLFESNSRTILRTYINSEWTDFSLDGEPDEEDLIFPSEKGFFQKGLKLSRSNQANKILFSAAKLLSKRISSPRNTERLDRAITILDHSIKEKSIQKNSQIILKRNTNWSSLIELSRTILMNYSLGFSEIGSAFLPGYAISTQFAWEKLMLIATRRAFPNHFIMKTKYGYGLRTLRSGDQKNLTVTPDITIKNGGEIKLLLDSKYKPLPQGSKNSKAIISASDIYEAIAHLNATQTKTILLLYPQYQSLDSSIVTTNHSLETFKNGDQRVVAVSIEVSGMSKRKGLSILSERIESVVANYLE